MKQLYFLHIPKTAGRFVKENIRTTLYANDINSYTNTHYPHNVNLNDQAYIAGHFGTYPIDVVKDIEVACIVRHPVDARISYFNFIYEPQFAGQKEYDSIDSYVDKLRYYLFTDPNAASHKNYQARFICNPTDSRLFNASKFIREDEAILEQEGKFNDGKVFTWFVNNDKTSLEFAKKQIDSFSIVGTVDNIDEFMSKKQKWFKDNYGVTINWNKEKRVNPSEVTYNGVEYTTSKLKEMLTEEEKQSILDKNDIDYAIYNYVRSIENDIK
jgi:hypothetical protein